MARPRSTDRRESILSAATRVVAARGPGASKAGLFNELYVGLKTGMGTAATAGLPTDGGLREQVLHMWNQWLHWATSSPEKRRTLAQLEVSGEITPETHQITSSAFDGIADLLERARVDGPMREVPRAFVLALTTAVADATVDAIIREPGRAEAGGRAAFDAVWRMLA